MEYAFQLSELFPEEITVIGNDLIPIGCPMLNQLGPKIVRERVSEILDTMGRASAEAQSLHSIITNAEKLKSGENKLYMFCDFVSNRAVGLLKIGKKKLFLFDDAGTQHELNPFCILDFYIHESRQRQGAGKYLFDHMLREEGIPVQHFAIDRPSDKFVYFLRKHYGCTKVLPQVNNFVLFDGFFTDRADYQGKKKRWEGLDQTADIRHVAHPKDKASRMEDSLTYNVEPLIHLRNGAQLPPNYTQRRHINSIGDILQPNHGGVNQPVNHHHHGNGTTGNGANGNGHHHVDHHDFIRPSSTRGSSVAGDRFDLQVIDTAAVGDLEYDQLRRQPRRISRLTSLNASDIEIHYQFNVQNMRSEQFQKLRTSSRNHGVDQGHEALW
ncbi:alpha-tubulin N-acetyltransferase [Folsomia candida]|uniref:alpha-tubulin N-acetyltransferase n=1 Tax=Folsomia candida TaxID=158441 RepID=UPI0016051CEC|nr:alpha-tubulin N-acetyltransferase [Folsomia candida]